jgi:hypothetical protein
MPLVRSVAKAHILLQYTACDKELCFCAFIVRVVSPVHAHAMSACRRHSHVRRYAARHAQLWRKRFVRDHEELAELVSVVSADLLCGNVDGRAVLRVAL